MKKMVFHAYEGAPYEKTAEQTVEITIERGMKDKTTPQVPEKENLL